jgi:NADH-quinone oxidoreductase subunit A
VEIAGQNWLIVGLMSAAAIGMGMTLLILNLIIGPSKPSEAKAAPYESGVPDVSPVKARFTPRFYMVAMLFVVFDIEAVFIFPWAVTFDVLGRYGFLAMLVFILLLLEGYVYAWKKGALEWV